jgi:hypothetical protein
MTASDLKMEIFRRIETLDKDKLEEFYGVLLNYINGQQNLDEWEKLTEEQKKGLLDSIQEINAGKGSIHAEVMTKFRNKYKDA